MGQTVQGQRQGKALLGSVDSQAKGKTGFDSMPQWRVDELLDIPGLADGYNIHDIDALVRTHPPSIAAPVHASLQLFLALVCAHCAFRLRSYHEYCRRSKGDHLQITPEAPGRQVKRRKEAFK